MLTTYLSLEFRDNNEFRVSYTVVFLLLWVSRNEMWDRFLFTVAYGQQHGLGGWWLSTSEGAINGSRVMLRGSLSKVSCNLALWILGPEPLFRGGPQEH